MFTQLTKATLALMLAIGTVTASAAIADEVAYPVGVPLLTVSGDIAVTNVGEELVFDREALMALDASSFVTQTIWTEGENTFQGVSLKTLADLLGAESGTFLATAINDYTVEIPLADAEEGGPIIAYLMDGQRMSIRDKGPLWIVYPFDSSAKYRSEVVYARSIWQLDRLEYVK